MKTNPQLPQPTMTKQLFSQVLGDQEIPQSGRSYWEARRTAVPTVATKQVGVCFDADFSFEGFSQMAQNEFEIKIIQNPKETC